ncbi:hypothetical protein NQ314_006049 [Rhamnusium bicolor]|uniref:CRAL-TRIO domain-containing protein n=1 Tax=Rhamnusium bicolor TaxID=1586634 RepID=A0AAV8ZAY3_9CUCU|nr:hypothetical protein NQ314_006049 [Rhamnusium bicolor]
MSGERIKKEFSEEEKKNNESLNKLQSDDAYLERFLYSTNFVVEKAFKRMKMFYDLLEEHPQWFAMGPPLAKKVIIEKDIRLLTSVYDKVGRPVYIVKIGNMSWKTMDLVSDVVSVDDIFMEWLLANDPATRNGISIIIDISNFSWNLMRWLTPSNIKIILRRIQTMPVKQFKYHLVNSSLLIHAAINIIWPFLSPHIRDEVKFHFDDWNSLYEYIDREVLPPEYGGTNNMDFTKYREQVYQNNEEIANSFRINRELYLKKHRNKYL